MKFGTDRIRRQLPRQELQTSEEAEVFFDPARDFDPEAKCTMLEDLKKGGKGGWNVRTDHVEYFYALFGDEFRALHAHRQVQFHLQERITKKLGVRGRLGMRWERKPAFVLAEKYALLFPAELASLKLSPNSFSFISELLAQASPGETDFVRTLFWCKLFFPNQPVAKDQLDQEWKAIMNRLPRVRKDQLPQSLWRHFAYLRLVFPDKDVASLITPADRQVFRRMLRELSLNPLKPDSLSMDNRAHYASLAWSGAIASAEKVEMTKDGRILFEMPKRSIQPAPPLPLRPTL